MEVVTVRTPGLGDSTYILTHGDIGIVVDPQRDVDRFEAVVDSADVELRFVLETHLHNDYISGATHLARARGADLVIPASAAPAYRHLPAFHLEDIAAGDLVIRPIHTPGHTPEHTSYLVLIEGKEAAVFSGGSLLTGSAGRSDLLGPERAETLARLQYVSVNRLAQLPDSVRLFPTHGEGSFCTASGAGRDTSTIGDEKAGNPVLAHPDEEAFVTFQLSASLPFPTYYRYMGPANLRGAPPADLSRPPAVDSAKLEALGPDIAIVDARPKRDFAAGHLAGSLAIELRNDFGTWAGWVLPYGAPMVLVLNPDQDLDEAIRQLTRVGLDDIRGVISRLADWEAPLQSYRLANTHEFADAIRDGAQVLDARAPNEWELGTIAGSTLAYAPDVVSEIPPDLEREREVWVACGTGYRANLAASCLRNRGFEPVVLAEAGILDVLKALEDVPGDN